MADPGSFGRTHVGVSQKKASYPAAKRKSCAQFLCKPLIILCLAVVIPLFPSKPPEFIDQPILVKFWDLVYLSFIGITVCYGIFSRRNVEMDPEDHYHPKTNDLDMYLGNPFGSDERNEIQTWKSHYDVRSGYDLGMNNVGRDSTFRSSRNSGSAESDSDTGSSSGLDLSSKGFRSIETESFSELGVSNVNQENMESEVSVPLSAPWSAVPVRTGMREIGIDSTFSDSMPFSSKEFQYELSAPWSSESESYSSSKPSPLDSMVLSQSVRFEGFDPSNSSQSLRSIGSGNYQTEEGNAVNSLNSVPHLAEKIVYEQIEPSILPMDFFSSNTISVSSSISNISPSFSVGSKLSSSTIEELVREGSCPSSLTTSQLENSKVEEFDGRENSASWMTSESMNFKRDEFEERSSPSSTVTSEMPDLGIQPESGKSSSSSCTFPASLPVAKPIKRRPKLLSNVSQNKYGSSSQRNAASSFKEESEDVSRRKEVLENDADEEQAAASLKSDMKSETPEKASLRGKSVRTIRLRRDVVETRKGGEIFQEALLGETSKEVDVGLIGKAGRKPGVDNLSVGSTIQNVDSPVVDVVPEEKFQDDMIREKYDKAEGEKMGEVGRELFIVGNDNLSVDSGKQNVDNPVMEERKAKDSCRDQREDLHEKGNNKVEVGLRRKARRRMRQLDDPSLGIRKHEFENSITKPKHKDLTYHQGRMQGFHENVTVESESLDKGGHKIGARLNAEQSEADLADTNEIDKKAGEFITKFREQMKSEKAASHEVDKKAGEFIAKFKEQIRLEKISTRSH